MARRGMKPSPAKPVRRAGTSRGKVRIAPAKLAGVSKPVRRRRRGPSKPPPGFKR